MASGCVPCSIECGSNDFVDTRAPTLTVSLTPFPLCTVIIIYVNRYLCDYLHRQHLTTSNNIISLVGDDLMKPALPWHHSAESDNVSLVRRTIHFHHLDTTAPLNMSNKLPFVRLITLSSHWSATEYQTSRYRYDWPCFCSSTLHVNTTTGRGQNRK